MPAFSINKPSIYPLSDEPSAGALAEQHDPLHATAIRQLPAG